MLCPKGVLDKSVRYIFILTLMCAILALIRGVGNINFNPIQNEIVLNESDINAIGARLTFEQALKNNSIEFSKITVCTDKLQDNSIIINKVVVYSQEAREKILEVFGNPQEYEVIVINE